MSCFAVRYFCPLVAILVLVAGYASAGPTTVVPLAPDVDCLLDHDNSNPTLDRCLEKGKKFVKRLVKKLTANDQGYDICGQDSVKFITCMDPLIQNCQSIRTSLHGHWRQVTDYINGVCTDKKPEYVESHQCLLEEYGAPLIGRCDDLHSFNIKQKTRDKCHFLRENVNCKDALITSKCGELTGSFAYHALRLYHDEFMRQEGCHLPREPNYRGFRYTDIGGQCVTFLDDLKQCIRPYISRSQMLKFRDDNALVVDASENYKKKEVKDACSRFKRYQECLVPINESCPRGLHQVYEIDHDLRQYVLKMDFICGRGKKGYIPSIKCYNLLHDDNFMTQCNRNLWDDVDVYLKNVTSYDFYCQENKNNVQNLKRELHKVALCYKEVTDGVDKCGAAAGQTLVEFMDIVFRDPSYLRMDFKADCELHRGTTTTTKPSTTPTMRRHHKASARPTQRPPPPHPPTKSGPSRTESPKSDKSILISGAHSTKHRCSVFSLLVTFLYALHFAIT